MNEQNNLNTETNQQSSQNVQPTPVVDAPVSAPVSQENVAPSTEPVQNVVTQPVAPTLEPAPVEVTPQPVQEVAVQAVEVPATPVSIPEAVQQPVTQTVSNTTTSVASASAPAPVQETTIVEPQANVAVAQAVPSQPAQPVQPTVQEAPATQTDIVAQAQPLNPLANEPAQAAVNNSNGVITPSVPLTPAQPIGGAVDSSNVGFVAVSEPPKKKKNKPLIITIVLVILIGLAALGYFVIYPFVVNKFFSDPKKVYETVIKTAFNELSSNATEVIHSKAIYDLQFSFDSNIPNLESYGGYTYGINFGVDPTNEAVQSGFMISDNKVGTSTAQTYYSYLKDGKKYLKYSTNRNLIYAGEANLEELDSLFNMFSFSDILETAKNTNGEDTAYLINKFADLLVGSLDESKLSKEEASIKVNGKTLKVFNNKYQINQATAEATAKHIVNGFAEDDKSLEIIATLLDMETSTLKEKLKSISEDNEASEEDEEENDTVITFSIYTTMGIKPSVVGYGVKTSENDSTIHFYNTEDYFEFKLYSVEKDTETNKEIENTFDVIGKTANGKTNVSVNLNDKEIMTLKVKEWSDTAKDVDYTLMIDDESAITGSIKYTKDLTDDKLKNSFEFSLEMGEQIVTVIVDFSVDWKKEVSYIVTNNAVTLSDDQIAEQHTIFLNAVYETPIGQLFKTVSGDVTPGIDDYYTEVPLN